jgi:hypothetical protein
MYARVGDDLYFHGSSEPDAPGAQRGSAGVHYGHTHRRPGACPIGFQSLYELPLRGRPWPSETDR